MGLILADQNRITAGVQPDNAVSAILYSMSDKLPGADFKSWVFKMNRTIYDRANVEYKAAFLEPKHELKTYQGIDIVIDDELPADTIYLMPK